MSDFSKTKQRRINVLQRCNILDSRSDGTFSNITRLAAQMIRVPIALISFFDTDRSWFRSKNDGPCILTDSSIDPRSVSNPLVARRNGFYFYAGVPLTTFDQNSLGVLCVADFAPRKISDDEINILKRLAQVVMDEVELRLSVRREAECKLELEALLHSIDEGIFGLDLFGNITFWNRSAVKLTGFQTKEMVRQSAFYSNKPFSNQFLNAYQQMLDSGEAVEVSGDHFLKKNWSSFPVDYRVTPRFKHRRIVGAVVNFRDISDKLREVERIRKKVRLNTVSQLAAGLAHEIRNPLTTLKGFLQLMNPTKNPKIEIMKEEVEQIEKVVNDLFLLSETKAMQVVDTDLRSAITDVVDAVVQSSSTRLKGIHFDYHFEEHPRMVPCSPEQLKIAFSHIIKNAMEAMPDGGTITISCKGDHDDVVIEIKDTGVGISLERLKTLGQPHYCTKEQGTGMGLTATYKIINEHGGEIDIESKLKEGTTVKIRLPVAGPQILCKF